MDDWRIAAGAGRSHASLHFIRCREKWGRRNGHLFLSAEKSICTTWRPAQPGPLQLSLAVASRRSGLRGLNWCASHAALRRRAGRPRLGYELGGEKPGSWSALPAPPSAATQPVPLHNSASDWEGCNVAVANPAASATMPAKTFVPRVFCPITLLRVRSGSS